MSTAPDPDYVKFRGRCKELSDAAIAADPSLTLVRGYYDCPLWGRQAHWWTVRPDGTIYDPSVAQFPTKGFAATYVPFDGMLACEECGEPVADVDACFSGRHPFCSGACMAKAVL